MKKLIIIPLAFMITCVSFFKASADFPFNSKTWKNVSQSLEVINVCDLNTQDLNEIMLGNHPEIAMEFSAQTTLPISFFLKGDLVQLKHEGSFGAVEIMQTFYARCVQQELVISTNLIDWKPFLEFITGQASVSLSIQEGKPSIIVGAEANKRA